MSDGSQLLRRSLWALAQGEGLNDLAEADTYEIDAVVASGLGPLIYHLLLRGGAAIPDLARPLQAAHLTSRVMNAELSDGVTYALAALHAQGLEATLLKGISLASRYYPAPHLRVMGDIDILLPSEQIETGVTALLEAGFVIPEPAGPIDYAEHIHAPALFHPQRELWIELHRRLILPAFAASAEAPLNLENLAAHQLDGRFADQRVKYLTPEFELAYLAVGWCRDLTGGWAHPGLRRTLFDAVVLLQAVGRFDWDQVQGWSRNTLTGACLYILLSYLAKHALFDDKREVLPALRSNQPFVNAASLKVMHRLFDRYLLGTRRFGPPATSNNVSALFEALISPRPAWRNLLAAPANVVFPRRQSRRYDWRFQLARLGTLVGKR